MYVHECNLTYIMVCTWRSEDNFWSLFFSSTVGSKKDLKLSGLYLLSLFMPSHLLWKWKQKEVRMLCIRYSDQMISPMPHFPAGEFYKIPIFILCILWWILHWDFCMIKLLYYLSSSVKKTLAISIRHFMQALDKAK